MALSTNRLIKVDLTINPRAAANRGFGTLLVAGDSDVITPSERFRNYTSVNQVAEDFGVTAPEYKAAELYYSQDPAPTDLMIARWNRTAAPSVLTGAILLDAEQDVTKWQQITDGKFQYNLNNNPVVVEHIDLSGVESLAGVAGAINLRASDIEVTYTPEGRFIVQSKATGSDQNLTYFSDAPEQINVAAMLGLSGAVQTTDGADLIPEVPQVDAKPAVLTGGTAALSPLQGITDGSFKITVNGTPLSITNLDFSDAASLEDIAGKLNTKLSSVATVEVSEGGDAFVVETKLTGAACTIGYATQGEETTHAKEATAGEYQGTTVDLSTLKQVTDGSFKISIDGDEQSVTGQNYSSAESLDDIADSITTALGVGSIATCEVQGNTLVITSATTGASSTVSAATAGEKTHADTEATAGYFTAGQITDATTTGLAALQAISAGQLKLTLDAGSEQEVSNINLSSATDMNNAATLLQAALTGVTVTFETDHFIFTSNTKGADSKVVIAAGTDAGLATALNVVGGTPTQGKAFVAGTDTDLGTKLGLVTGQAIQGTDAVKATDTDLGTKLGLTQATGASTQNGADLIPAIPEVPAKPAVLTGARPEDLSNIRAVQDGAMRLNNQDLLDLNFSGCNTLSDVASLLTGKLTGASVAAQDGKLVVTTERTGASAHLDAASDVALTEKNIAALLKLTRDTATAQSAGFDAESPVQLAQVVADKSAAWYALTFAAARMPSEDQLVECAQFIEANTDTTHILGITTSDTRVLDTQYTEDIASRCKELGLNRTVIQYSQNPYAICSFLGRAFTVNFNGNMTTITMMYKGEPNVAAEDISETQAQALENKRCNVFVKYNNDTDIIQYGVMSGDYWFDERHGADWLKDYVQTAIWNYVYTSTTKIGQNDAGMNQIVSVINQALVQAQTNGFIGAGTWNGDSFGQLQRGQYMPDGFYVYCPPMATQSQADRDARISVPIQVAAKLLGAIHTFDVAITLNR